MAYPLPTHYHDEIFRTMNSAFRELPFYDKVIEPKIMKVLADSDRVIMDQRVHKRLTERYYDVAEFNKTDQGKLMLTQIHIAVRVCYVLVMTYHPLKRDLLWGDVSQLLENYPEFCDQDQQELQYLLQFRNMIRLALEIIPPRLNKKLLINVAARLEGSGKEYITGGGQKPCVTRRVIIYEREGSVQAEKRDERQRRPRINGSSSVADSVDDVSTSDSATLTVRKRKQLNPSMKKLKMIRLDSHEAKQYIRTTVPLPLPLPPNALLTLSRECSKHLMQTDDENEATEVDESATIFDDLLLFQPGSISRGTSASFLVPPFQARSGTLNVPLAMSGSTTASTVANVSSHVGALYPPQSSYCPSSSSALPPLQHNGNGLQRDISEFSFHFPPGFLSRQQSELLTNLCAGMGQQSCTTGAAGNQDLSWLAAWDAIIAEQQQASYEGHDGLANKTHSAKQVASVVLPMLRAVSRDVTMENTGFSDDLMRVLSTF